MSALIFSFPGSSGLPYGQAFNKGSLHVVVFTPPGLISWCVHLYCVSFTVQLVYIHWILSHPVCASLLCYMLSAPLLCEEQRRNKNTQHAFRGRLTADCDIFQLTAIKLVLTD